MQSIFFLSYGSAQRAARKYCIHLGTMRRFRKEGEHSEQGKKASIGWQHQAAEMVNFLTWSLQHGNIFFKQLWYHYVPCG